MRSPPPWRRNAALQRAVYTMLDQALCSMSNFAVGVAVARLAGAASLGAFALAYALWLLLAACHRALITDPLIIYGDGISGSAKPMRSGLGAEVVLGAMAALMVATGGGALLMLGQHRFGVALLVLAPFLVPLLVQDYWRWIGFMLGKPSRSLMNDGVFNMVQAVSFVTMVAFGHHSLAVAVSAWGIGATAAALFGVWQFSIRPGFGEAVAFVRARWATGRWLLLDSSTGWGAGQAYMILVGAILGPVGLGGLRAAQTLMAPALVLTQATSSLGLPEASRAFQTRGHAALRRAAILITAVGVLSVAVVTTVVMMAGERLLRLLYGPAYTHYADAARILALGILLLTLNGLPEIMLKLTRRTRSLIVARSWNMAVTLAAFLALTPRLGLPGAAWAYVAGAGANLLILAYVFGRIGAWSTGPNRVDVRLQISESLPRRSA